MIIPISTQSISIGDKVINIKEINNTFCIIVIGHEFTVIGYDKEYNRFICEDTDNNITINLSKEIITKKISLELAEKELIFKTETRQYKDHIFLICPNRGEEYDDREAYDSCKLKTGYNNSCTPTIECAKHLTKDDIKKSIVLSKHLRLNKLTKLKHAHVKETTK